MRDPKRIKRILKLIEKHWTKYPDQRFFQLLTNIGLYHHKQDAWYVEDDVTEEHLNHVKL